MGFAASHRTITNLLGVKKPLIAVVMRVLQISPVDFVIIQGLRTPDEQRADVAAGKSKTLQSRHLTGDAVDFCALVNGKGDETPPPYYRIALAFRQASIDLDTPLVWGAIWDRPLSSLSDNPQADVEEYRQRELALGVRRPLIDLDHVELDRHTYP